MNRLTLVATLAFSFSGAGSKAEAGDADVQFAAQPAIRADGGGYRISFTLNRPADVEVGIVDQAGKVVRHLAAGLIGMPDTPTAAPLKKGSLAQELVWDGKDDLGQVAAGKGGRFSVRVRAGLVPELEKMLGSQPGGFYGSTECLTVGPQGEMYILNCEVYKFGRAEMIVLDRNGKYLRTIMPYPAATPNERTESVGHLMADGRRIPILYSGHIAAVYPLACGMRSQTMAWHPKGYLVAVSSIGSAREHGPARYLLAFHPEGGAPAGVKFVGPQISQPRGFLGGGGERDNRGMDRVAVSPDGEWIYLVPSYAQPVKAPGRKHGVYRVKWSDAEIGQPWLGKAEAGDDDEHFNDPQGIAIDKEGRLFICDRGNNRVKVYSPDGKLLGKFAADSPEQIALDHKTGAMFVLSREADRKAKKSTLIAFTPFEGGGAKKAFELPAEAIRSMSLDESGESPRLWVVVPGAWLKPDKVMPVAIRADKFEPGEPLNVPVGLSCPSFLAATPDGSRVIVKEHYRAAGYKPFRRFDVASGEAETLTLKGCDIAIDSQGNFYTLDGYETNSLSRYDPAGKPLPFPATGSNKLEVKFSSYGPDMAMRGQCVDLRGNIYVIRFENHVRGAALDVYAPDGSLKKANLIGGLGSADSGIGVDAVGNVYVGANVKDADKPLPAPFAGKVPTLNWIWWKKFPREAPWSYIYCNPYLFHMGQVFKFGSEGGAFYGNQQPAVSLPIMSAGTELDKAPADAVPFKSGYLKNDVKVAGAKWHYPGVGSIGASVDGPLPDPGCTCMPSHLAADLWGRVFAPNAFMFSVDMLDPAGNLIRRLGQYGTNDSPAGEITFLQPTACSYANDRLFVSDSANRRVLVIRLSFQAEATSRLE